MNRKILEAERKRLKKFVEEQNTRIEDITKKISRYQKLHDNFDLQATIDYFVNYETKKIEKTVEEIEAQKQRRAKAKESIPHFESLFKADPRNVEKKNKLKRAEFERDNAKDVIVQQTKYIKEYEDNIDKFKSMTEKDLKEHLQECIRSQEALIVNANNALKYETERFERDERAVKKSEKAREGVYIQDPDIDEHQISRALNPHFRKRLSAFTEIDAKTVRLASRIVRATHEKGVDRATFLIKCRLWESKQEDKETAEDQYYETTEAMKVLGSWIASNGEDPETFGDERFKGDPTELKQLYLLSMELIKNKMFLPEEKFDLAISFFTIKAFEYCYDMFLEILRNPLTRAPEKAEACKFLYYSENDEYIPEIEKYTMEIISNQELTDRFRFETIACYVTDLGLKTRYLQNPLATEGIDQELVTNLFKVFITTPTHPKYLVLAYTALLEQNVDETIKPDIEKKLLEMAKSTKFDKIVDEYVQDRIKKETYYMDEEEKKEYMEKIKNGAYKLDEMDQKTLAEKIHRIRADAADVLVRRNDSPYHKEAYDLVLELGESVEDLEINKTVYTNAENVHLLNEKSIEFVEKLYKQSNKKFVKIDEVVRDIEIMCDKFNVQVDDRMCIRKALDRVMMDASKFTSFEITMTTILLCIYNEINKHPQKKHIMARLLEELIDMAETCASGHAKRIVNVMVGYTEELEGMMDITYQLEANIKARINTAIKNLEEGDHKNAIMDGMVEEAKDRDPFHKFVKKVFYGGIYDELKDEFVVQGYLSQKKFDDKVKEVLAKL